MKGGNKMNYKRIRKSLLIMIIILMSMALVFGCSKKNDVDEPEDVDTVKDTTLTINESQTVTVGDDYEKIIVQASGVVLENGTVDEIMIEPQWERWDVTINIQEATKCSRWWKQ